MFCIYTDPEENWNEIYLKGESRPTLLVETDSDEVIWFKFYYYEWKYYKIKIFSDRNNLKINHFDKEKIEKELEIKKIDDRLIKCINKLFQKKKNFQISTILKDNLINLVEEYNNYLESKIRSKKKKN